MNNPNTMNIDLSANSLVVQEAVKQAGLKEGKNGGPAEPVGSSKKVHLPKTNPLPPEPKTKTYKVSISVAQEARLTREAYAKGVSNTEHLQSIIDSKLESDIGRPFVEGATFMGGRVMGPSNTKLQVTNNATR